MTSLRSRAAAHAFYERMGYSDICATSGRFFKTLGPVNIAEPARAEDPASAH